MKGTYLGEFEEIVLLAVGILGDDAYGVSIRKEIEMQSGRDVNIGAVHTAVHRLEAKGFLFERKINCNYIVVGTSRFCNTPIHQ